MSLPFFYHEHLDLHQELIELSEDSSKHIVQVLRMIPGEMLQLTNGKGILLLAEIVEAHKKKCVVAVKTSDVFTEPTHHISIAISPVKNNARFELF